jgi:hypothetical protein
MLTTKIDPLMKNLENLGLDHLKMVDAQVTYEECGEIGHMGVNCPMVCQVANFVGHSNNSFHPNQGFNFGWNKPVSYWTIDRRVVMGKIATEMSLNSRISLEIS